MSYNVECGKSFGSCSEILSICVQNVTRPYAIVSVFFELVPFVAPKL